MSFASTSSFKNIFDNNSNSYDFNNFNFIDFENNYISLEDLEQQISKESLLYSPINSNNVYKEKQNNSESKLDNNLITNDQNKKERPKDCVVCNLPTNCCYFDVPSCLGCRSFFRRSILGKRLYTCKYNENCQIDKGERCRACRFDKCLLGGMDFRNIQKFPDGFEIDKINSILTERKRQLISKKVLAPQNKENSIIMGEEFLSERLKPELEILKILAYSDDCLLYIRHSETDISTIFPYSSIFDILQPNGVGNFSIFSKANTFSKSRLIPRNYDYFYEQMQYGNNFMAPIWFFIDSFLFIEMTKTWPIVQQLSLGDKFQLYSHNGIVAIVFSQLFYSTYIQGSEIFIFPCGFSPLFVKNNQNSVNLFYKHILKIKEANLTKEEFLILRAAIFFHTASTELSSKGCKTLQIELDKLSKALMFYEQRKWGDTGGAERYAYLMLLITRAFQIGNVHKNFLAKVTEKKLSVHKINHPKFIGSLLFDEIY
ncbi:hypothetical protein Mgra_00000335 [Meloidogyne graminicola]|uniref:Nuclear receptor domain-containing protein n=1 Tax=Meloidogyne graminicola TaxID=189291 RepID=A0A8T0A4M9_9BILA|nr:hypothetical protein Mgra_00000335 [Meloidogyne graminicola]